MSFRTRIKELRARYDLTQEDLAKKVGVRRETILYLEKGTYNPSLLLSHKIATALKTTLDNLFIFEDKLKDDEILDDTSIEDWTEAIDETEALSKNYCNGNEIKVLKDMKLKVYWGEIFSSLVPNQAAKATTVQLLSYIIKTIIVTATLTGYGILKKGT